MRNRQCRSRYRRTAVAGLLSLMSVLNASQAMVVCVRHDGRVAIEPVVSDHCPCDTRTPDGGHADRPESITPYVADEHYHPCTDIPIPNGPCQNRASPVTSRMDSAGLTALLSSLPATVDAACATAFESPPALVFRPIPLDSIVLQV